MQVWQIGDPVQKKTGYQWPGVIVSKFVTLAGHERLVVECTVPEVAGALHIYSPEQIEWRDETKLTKYKRTDEETMMNAAIEDVIAERERQKSAEGWTPEHDDTHSCGELAQAAACYAYPTPWGVNPASQAEPPRLWPWDRKWWKPKDRRRNLVRAAALIIAEIERIDRNQKPTVAAIEAAERL